MNRRRISDQGVQPISFARRLVASETFTLLFREGMSLVEESAAYLDGAGRSESKMLSRTAALGYASESMRLTTRLMQLASWLLLQRAVNEGELTQAQAAAENRKVRLTRQDIASAPETFDLLPERLRDLSVRSIKLQDRVLRLDKLVCDTGEETLPAAPPTVQIQMARLQAAFGARPA